MTDEREQYASLMDSVSKTGLPISFECVLDAARAVSPILSKAMGRDNAPKSELAEYLDLLWEEWKDTGRPEKPSPALSQAVDSMLDADANVKFLKGSYFRVFHKLIDSCYLSSEEATSLLGSARLIHTMVMKERMSASRVRQVLNLDASIPYSAIQAITAVFKGTPEVTVDDVAEITKSDMSSMNRLFKDDDVEHSFGTIASVVDSLRGDTSIADDLRAIYKAKFDPYYCILHYEMLSVDKFDRCPGDTVYEFKPRGSALDAVWKMYQASTSNPYLNNAKAVSSLNAAWAEPRIVASKGNSSQGQDEMGHATTSLAHLFDAMSRLPYPSRHYLAMVIRCWLLRLLEEKAANTRPPIPMPGESGIRAFLEFVAAGNTETVGIMDQRAADFLTVVKHPDLRDKSRGLGSSVNETNYSARKFGDIEFIDTDSHEIWAYEAHGGSLTDEYVEGHLRTLRKVIPYREQDLNLIAPASDWTFHIGFIDHDNSLLSTHKNGDAVTNAGDYHADLFFTTYADLIHELGGVKLLASQHLDLFESLVHNRLSTYHVPQYVRDKYADTVAE